MKTEISEAVSHSLHIIRESFRSFGSRLAVLTSLQREGVVIVHLIRQVAPECRVLTIDTGRLPEQSQEMIQRVESFFGLTIERIRPEPAEVAAMVELHGSELFRFSYPKRLLCCDVRKVRPLAAYTKDLSGLFVGLRREQSSARRDIAVVDQTSTPVKISPLADWTAEEVMAYTREHGLPEHPLYQLGYTSIGCGPCTRAIQAGEPERSGRWWWETDLDKECGLHFTPEGGVVRTVDVLLQELLSNRAPLEH